MQWKLALGVAWIALMMCTSMLWASNPCPFYGDSADLVMDLIPPTFAAAGGLYVRWVARRRLLASAWLGAAAVLYAAIMLANLPFRVRWRVGRASFEAWTASADVHSRKVGRLGMFGDVTVESGTDGAIRFDLSQERGCRACLICYACEVVWLPSPPQHDPLLEPLGGNWYWRRGCT